MVFLKFASGKQGHSTVRRMAHDASKGRYATKAALLRFRSRSQGLRKPGSGRQRTPHPSSACTWPNTAEDERGVVNPCAINASQPAGVPLQSNGSLQSTQQHSTGSASGLQHQIARHSAWLQIAMPQRERTRKRPHSLRRAAHDGQRSVQLVCWRPPDAGVERQLERRGCGHWIVAWSKLG